MLAKMTALLLMPPLFVALAMKAISQRSPILTWLRTIGLTVAVSLITCGWHYGRIWRHFGTPFIGNWDAVTGFSWWQDPGYRMAADYVRFGRTLADPFFSGLAGFWDGIYSTLWGDGLWGGLSDIASRTPWSYDLVASGYLLAVVPSLLILTGAGVALVRVVRKGSAEWFVLLGFCAMVVCGVIFMTLKVPSYAQVKAFYGLSALVPLSCCAALGWETVRRSGKTLQIAVGGMVTLWALNSFTSLWIRDSAALHVYAGAKWRGARQPAAAMAEASRAVQVEPSSEMAHRFLSLILQEANRLAEAEKEAQRAVQLAPTSSATHLQLSIVLMKQRQSDAAIKEARKAVELGPENSVAYAVLLTSLREEYRDHEVIEMAPEALAISPFAPDIHYAYGVSAARENDFMTAADQFGYALLFRTDWAKAASNLRAVLGLLATTVDGQTRLRQAATRAPDSPAVLNEFAWVFATFPDVTVLDGAEAVRLAERICSASQRKVPRFLATLAASYAEAGRFPEAVKTADKARALAKTTGDSSTAGKSEKMLALFKVNQAYREEPVQPTRP
jgi:tetratricopeptide (TPR) repeat protein